ncbi:MAG TPA: Uma2 family endonuclease, partial [Myxococcales bacterium]|jgi:Uma2 family endonuclease|nr:Uma2 family endonuclease [Myxococcales bacterium]
MAIPASKPATYEDLRSLPDHVLGQIIGGDLMVAPRPAVPHARASSILGEELSGPYDRGRGGPGGWWILDEPEIHLAGDVLVPDLAGWRRSRLPELRAEPFLSLSPDWVCEVLSPGTKGIDRVRKLPIYAREHVAHVWLVDPEERTLEVFRLHEGKFVLVGTFDGAALVRAEPFDQVAIELGALWLTPA